MAQAFETGAPLTRRGFLVGAGAAGGLAMGWTVLPEFGIGAAHAATPFEPNLWLTIDDAGVTTVHIVKAEMGQHVGTAIAQSVAEELEANWEDVRIDYPDADPRFGLFLTGGSWSVNWTFDKMSRAGAAGRIALVDEAARKWGVQPQECRAENGTVMHPASARKVTYAELVRAGVKPRVFSEDELKSIELKPATQRRIVGRPVAALDIPEKTNGTAVFGIDSFAENMLYAAPVTPPVRAGAKVLSIDDEVARQVAGYVRAVTLEDPTATITGWVVALAETYPAATKAAAALKVSYDAGPNARASSSSILDEAEQLQADGKDAVPFVLKGDAAKAIVDAPVKHEAVYTTELNIHSPLEPMNALAEWKDGKWHFTCGNQYQTLAMGKLPVALGVKPEEVVLHQRLLGGGYGRRLDHDYMIAAGLAAKAAGRPVKLIYTREHDMQMDFTRSITYQVLKGGADPDGNLVGLSHDVVSASATLRQDPGSMADGVGKTGKLDPFSVNGADFWYTLPNHTVRSILSKQGQAATPKGYLRSVAPGWTFFAVESFLDELAHKSGKDPVAMRLAMLDGKGENAGKAPSSVGGAKRLANVLRVAVEKSGYGTKTLPKDTAMGVACVSSQERTTPSWTVCVAEVSVDRATGDFNVRKLTVVSDVGTAVNPDGVTAQLEGATLWGLSLATLEKATLRDGAIEQTNFDSYKTLRMADVPELEIVTVQTGDYPVGVGEPATTAVAPALANAIHGAVGARVRSLPITAEAVKGAMRA
jgi:isoquinoline 1-oxidoreductase